MYGIHPNWGGHSSWPQSFFRECMPRRMSVRVTFDAAAHSIMASGGCSVEWQDMPNGVVQFKRTDEALPWPIPVDPQIDTVLKIPGFDPIAALDRYGLKVTGLKDVAYTLKIR